MRGSVTGWAAPPSAGISGPFPATHPAVLETIALSNPRMALCKLPHLLPDCCSCRWTSSSPPHSRYTGRRGLRDRAIQFPFTGSFPLKNQFAKYIQLATDCESIYSRPGWCTNAPSSSTVKRMMLSIGGGKLRRGHSLVGMGISLRIATRIDSWPTPLPIQLAYSLATWTTGALPPLICLLSSLVRSDDR